MTRSEANTRVDLIDPAIRKAGWDLNDANQVGEEIPVDGYDAEPWNGISDYILLRENGEILAVIEAKKTMIDSRLAQQQTEHYVTEITKKQSFQPFAFMTNGEEIYFLDKGNSAKRRVYGFFSRKDLERLLATRKNGKALTEIPINQDITNRVYQIEAIKSVTEAFEQKRRKALIVMATGTGKTRTAMSLIDLFMRANQARNILFVADRDALVKQAKTEGFETYIPDEPCARIFSTNIDDVKSNRLFVATLQTMSTQYQNFTPSFFDLIVFDEVHRSIFNKYAVVMEYFDARMIGLTATPADFINRSTFVAFERTDGTPNYYYGYEQAIKDGYLVDYSLYRAKTSKQIQGIKSAYLTEEERNELIAQGLDPDEINYDGSELERTVSNKDTLRQQWAEFMDVCIKDEGGKPCKTIVFAMTQKHALRLEETFNEQYPQYPNMFKVITYKSEYKGKSIKQFKREDDPRIAISVDMLETGVNVPEIMNLVFMRPVQSKIKMLQMIGRGTRTKEASKYPTRLPKGEKESFLIIDFWDNDFNKEADETIAQALPVAVSLFNTRLKLLEQHLDAQNNESAQRLIKALRDAIERIPLDAFEVKKVLHIISDVLKNEFWFYITSEKMRLLKNHVAPLMQYIPNVDIAAETFIHKIERLRVAISENNRTEGLINTIKDDISHLPSIVFEKQASKDLAMYILSTDFDPHNDEKLNQAIVLLAGYMRQKTKTRNEPLMLDLADRIQMSGYIILNKTGQEVYVTRYREMVEQEVIDLVENHPTIKMINSGKKISDEDLLEIERTLRQKLGNSVLELDDKKMRTTFGSKVTSLLSLLREILDLDANDIPDYSDIVHRQFEAFIRTNEARFNSQQTRFLMLIATELAKRGKLEIADLYGRPFDTLGQDAIERYFTEEQIQTLVRFTESLSA